MKKIITGIAVFLFIICCLILITHIKQFKTENNKKETIMTYESDFFEIKYEAQNEELLHNITEPINENLLRIMNFFEIEKLDRKIQIKIYPTLESWKNFINSIGEYQDYIVGCVVRGTIHVLAYDEYKKTNNHRNDTIEDYQKIIIHECVHFCHNQIFTGLYAEPFFIFEGLATYLAGQNYNTQINVDYSKEILFDSSKFMQMTNDPYSASQKIMRKLIEKVSHEQLLEYARTPQNLCNDWEKIGM